MRKLESVHPFKLNLETKGNSRAKQGSESPVAEKCLHHLFEAQVAKQPEAVAITFNGREINYGTLNQHSNRIAHALLTIGVEPQQQVAILLEPGPLQVESLFGILKAGATFVCLDTAHPNDRLIRILQETKPAVMITETASLSRHTALLPRLKEFKIALFQLDQDVNEQYDATCYGQDFLKSSPQTNPQVQIAPGEPAYIVYTSGSTGTPKGIVQSHRSFTQFIEWQSRQFEITAPQRWAQWASIGYDASYCEIFGTLSFGATLCMADNQVRHDPTQLATWAREEHITILQFVPSFCREVIEVLKSEIREGEHPLPELRYLLLAGEPLPVDLAATWLYEFPNSPKLFNLYGPSETVLATYYHVKEVSANQRSIPIGHAIDGREILILDDESEPCSEGIRGEIYIRSAYLAMGYFQRPQETKQKFLQNPLHDNYPDPVYRTGDLGRILPDGNIEFSGRTDNLVKIRGFRVELEEIEAVLNQHEDVREAIVVAHHQKKKNGQQIVAYITPRKEKTIDRNALRRTLKNSLPEYMVPTGFLFLEQLPRNANGKIDRKQLSHYEWDKLADRHVFQAPVNELQLKLVRIWEQLLDLKHIGIHDDFFAIGGHSLVAVKLFDLIRREFGKSLLPDTLITSPTIEELASEITKAGWNPEHQAVVELQPYGDRPPFFCVPGALGGVMYMSDLAHCLKQRPFYGLRPQDLHFGQPPLLTIEDIATTLVEEMRAIQPNGPYYLGGHSFGCAVAFEMACQLQKSGEQIDRLVFFDYVADEIPLRPSRSLQGKLRDSMIEFLYWIGILGFLRNFIYGSEKASSDFWHNLFDIPLINVLAEKYHQADKFQGRILLFRAVGDEYDPELGLLKLAESVDVEYVPGDHTSMFKEPNVKTVAEKLEHCLSQPNEKRS